MELFNIFKTNLEKFKLVLFNKNKKIKIKNETNIILSQPQLIFFDKEQIKLIEQNNIKKLVERLLQTPEERKIPIETYKVDNSVRKLQTITEENLRNAFIELIAKAGDSNYAKNVLPSYQDVLSNLTPEEAKFLLDFYKSKEINIPLGRILYSFEDKSYKIVLENFISNFKDNFGDFSFGTLQKINLYMTNLERLGLIKTNFGGHRGGITLTKKELYDDLKKDFEHFKKQINQKQDGEFKLEFGYMNITPFGVSFLEIINNSN